MEFKDNLKNLSESIVKIKNRIQNEEMTKHSLILPFVKLLGYDIFNPLEVMPEYTADYGIKKGEKVDYALLNDGKPIVFLEAKSVKESLSNHDNQLARYFNTNPNVKLAILTNGIIYKFFTDLDYTNLMDKQPFFEFDITNLKDSDIEILENFRKEKYSNDMLLTLSKELKYKLIIGRKLKNLLREPDDNFIRYLIKECGFNESDKLVEYLKPIVKKSIDDIISKKENDSINDNEHIKNNTNISINNNNNILTTELPSFRNGGDSIFHIFMGKNNITSGILLTNSNKFRVFKGSKAVLEEKKSGKSSSKVRKKLIEEDILKKFDDNYYIFVKDYIFNSPSQASSVILGRRSNGWVEWKNDNNETLRYVYR